MKLIIITFFLFSANCINAQIAVDAFLNKKFDEYILEHVSNSDFSGTVLVAKKDTVLFQKAYGKASGSSDNFMDTRFRLSSITKTFTGALITQLKEQGLLTFNDPVSKFLPDYPGGDKITIEHLLRHRSGIPDYASFPDFAEKMKSLMTLQEIVNWFKDKPLLFSPGSSNSYTNSGYTLLACIAEKVKNERFELLLKQQLLVPLGLENTSIDHYSDYGKKGNAEGYKIKGNHNKDWVSPYYIENFIGSGFLCANAYDLYKWTKMIITSKVFDIQKSQLYGWATRNYFGHDLVEQSGRTDGFIAYTSYFLKDGLMIVYLGNIESYVFNKMKKDLAAIYYGISFEKPEFRKDINLKKKDRIKWAGTYRLDAATTFTISETKKGLAFTYNASQTKHELIPLTGNRLFLRLYGVTLKLREDSSINWKSDDLNSECKKQ